MRIPTRVPRPIDPEPSNFRKIYILLNLYVGPDRRSRSAKRPAGRPVDTGPRSTPRPGSILSEKCVPMAFEVRWPMIMLAREPEHCWSRRTAPPATITQSLPRNGSQPGVVPVAPSVHLLPVSVVRSPRMDNYTVSYLIRKIYISLLFFGTATGGFGCRSRFRRQSCPATGPKSGVSRSMLVDNLS
jgi:hypothetical protein